MTAAPDRPRGRRRAVEIAVSAGLGAALLVLVFRGVSWREFTAALSSADPGMLALSGALFVLTHASRGFRWMQVVRRVQPLDFRRAYGIQSVGVLAIQGLPLRLGELVRPTLLRQRVGVPFGAGMFTVIVERAIDLIALGLLLLACVALADLPLDAVSVGGWEVDLAHEGRRAIGLALVPFLGALVAAAVLGDRFTRATEAVLRPLHAGLAARVASLVRSFVDGVVTLRDPRFGWTMTWTTALVWGANVAAMWTLCLAFPFAHLDAIGGAVLLVILVLGLMVPNPPFSVGVVEAFLVGGLALYGIDRDGGAAIAVAFRALNLTLVCGLGVGFLLADGVPLGSVLGAGGDGEG